MKIASLLISLMIAAAISLDNEAWLEFLKTNEHQVPKAVENHRANENQHVSQAQRRAITRGAKWQQTRTHSGTTPDTSRASRK
jgi:hypothetical protein